MSGDEAGPGARVKVIDRILGQKVAEPRVGVVDRLLGAPRPAAEGSFYVRLLRLHHLAPSVWQRVLFVEGALLVGVVLTLADLATAWTPLVLPLVVAGLVKVVDVVVGLLPPAAER